MNPKSETRQIKAEKFHARFDSELKDEYIRLSEFCGSHELMLAVHIPCGHIRCAAARDYFRKGCPVCKRQEARTERKVKVAQKHIEEIERQYDVTAVSKYEGARVPMLWRCNKCGAVFERNVEDILWRKDGFGKGIQHDCTRPYKKLLGLLKGRLAYLKRVERETVWKEKRLQEIEVLCAKYRSTGYSIIEVEDDNYTIVLRHDRCGHIFTSDIDRMRKGYGCLLCSRSGFSRGVEKIINYLDDNGVTYDREIKFDSCRRQKRLPFDFVIYDSVGTPTHAIEFNGEQHYRASAMFGGPDKLAKVQEADHIKRQWCVEHNLPLLVIRYDEDVAITLDAFFRAHPVN